MTSSSPYPFAFLEYSHLINESKFAILAGSTGLKVPIYNMGTNPGHWSVIQGWAQGLIHATS